MSEKVYDNGTPAVIDFNLEVSKGEFIAFLGTVWLRQDDYAADDRGI